MRRGKRWKVLLVSSLWYTYRTQCRSALSTTRSKVASFISMSTGYLAPVAVRVCADASKGHGVFATALVRQGTLLWKPDQVKAVAADEITSTLAAMPDDKASVSAHLLGYYSPHQVNKLAHVFYRSFFASPLLLPVTQELYASIRLTMAVSPTTVAHPMWVPAWITQSIAMLCETLLMGRS